MTAHPTTHRRPRGFRRLAASTIVAAVLAAAAFVAPPTSVSASTDVWHNGVQPALESGSKVWGAYAKDMADKKIVNDVLVKADMNKYMISGGVTLALVAIDIALTLLIDEPSFEQQVMDRINDIRAEMHQMQFDLDALERSLEQILNQTHMAEFRTRHQALTSSTASVFAYQELLDIYTNPDVGTSQFAKRILVDNIIENVPAARADIIDKVTPGLTSLPAAYNAAAQPETALDDRDYYEVAFDYLAYWERVLEMANRQLLEAYNWKLRQPTTSEFEAASLQASIDELVAEQPAFQDVMWSQVSHPISNEEFVTLGNYALLPRDHASIDTSDPLRYEQYDWMNLTRMNWDDLVAAGAGGTGETLRAQLADQGLTVPGTIDLLEEDSYRAKAWVYGWIGGSQYGLKIQDNYSIRCTWVGFTETVTVTTQWVWGANGSKIYDDSPKTYHSGDTACLNPAHYDDANPAAIPAADLRGSEGAMFDTGGMPALVSNVWWISPEGTVDVYHDNELVERITETTGLTPGIVEELTFTTNEDDIPSSGWAVYADPTNNGGFVGKYAGTDTEVLDLAAGETSLIATLPPEPVRNGASIDVVSSGDGSVLLFEDGQALDLVEDDGSIRLPADATTIVVTDDGDDAFRNGLTMVVLPDDGEEFYGWFGDATGIGSTEIEIDAAGHYAFGAQFSDEPTPIDVTIDGAGTVDVYHDGTVVESVTSAATIDPEQFVAELALTTDPSMVPAEGWALVAHPDATNELRAWSEQHDAAADRMVVSSSAEHQVAATFAPVPTTFDVMVDGPGSLDLYENGDVVTTVDSIAEINAVDFATDVIVTSDPGAVPDEGLALLARPQGIDGRLVSFTGAASGFATQTIQVEPDSTVAIGAEFAAATLRGGIDTSASRLGYTSQYSGSNEPNWTSGQAQLSGDRLTNAGPIRAGHSIDTGGGWDQADLTVNSFSFDVDDDFNLTNGTASGSLYIDNGNLNGQSTHSLREPTGTFNPDTGRLTVDFPANGAGTSTVVFNLDRQPEDFVVDVTIDGPGALDLYVDGSIAETATESTSLAGSHTSREIVVTTEPSDVPANGLALVARGTLTGFTDAATGTATQTVVLNPDNTVQIGADFAEPAFVGELHRTDSRIAGKSLYWATGTVAGSSAAMSLATDRLAGQAQHTREDETVEITELDLEFDESGLVVASSVTGKVTLEEWQFPGLPPIAVDSITDVTGQLDLDTGELRLDVIDEHGTTRANLVLR